MDSNAALLKAIADGTRYRIVELLLEHNYCVRALARRVDRTEAAVSQHLKVLREAGLLTGEKEGYFMHYSVNREKLRVLARTFERMAAIEQKTDKPGRQHRGCGKRMMGTERSGKERAHA